MRQALEEVTTCLSEGMRGVKHIDEYRLNNEKQTHLQQEDFIKNN